MSGTGRRNAAPGSAVSGGSAAGGIGQHSFKSDATRPPSRGSLREASAASTGSAAAVAGSLSKLRMGRASTPGDASVLTAASMMQHAAAEPAPSDSVALGSTRRSSGIRAKPGAGAAQARLPAGGDLWVGRDQAGAPGGGPISRTIGGVAVNVPAWNQNRPFLTGLHLLQPELLDAEAGPHPGAADLASLPPEAAEQLLVDDVLSALSGLDGTYVRCQLAAAAGAGVGRAAADGPRASDRTRWSGPRLAWRVAVPLEPCLREQVERLLPLAECVAAVARYVETRASCAHGKVAQALGAAMRTQLEGWLLRVTQLEALQMRGQLSLATLGFYCQGPAASLELLADIAVEAACTAPSAAGLLNLLHAKAAALAGDREGRALVQGLLAAAAAPYFEVLEVWLTSGQLVDRYSEFMVQEDASVGKDAVTSTRELAFWHQRYTVRRVRGGGGEPDVPLFLRDCADVIVKTGKYLAAIRECGQPVVRPLGHGVRLAWDPSGGYLAHIQAAYEGASVALLSFVMRDAGLPGWLRSIKHFFLLDQGDLLVHLLEAAADDLARPAKGASAAARLQYALEAAVRGSSAAEDPHADIVSVKLDTRGFLELLRAVATGGELAELAADGRGAEALHRLHGEQRADARAALAPAWEQFMLKFSLGWPVSLVVSQRHLLAYQMIFKRLFGLKYVERQLTEVWALLQPARRMGREQQEAVKLWHALTARLMHFVQEYLRYCTVEVLEPLWQGMEAGMAKAANVDEVIACHDAFLSHALRAALLKHPSILNAVSRVLACAVTFCGSVKAMLPCEDDSPEGSAGAQPGAGGRGSAAARLLPQLELLASDASAAASIRQLHGKFNTAMDGLLAEMGRYCSELLQAAPAEPGLQQAEEGLGGMPLVMTSREELESLDDLISRLTLGSGV